jgi:type IV secretion system protein VirB9
VIRIPIAEGVVTTIEFNKREQVLDFAMGDRDAWHAKYKGNLFVLKPKDVQPDTNLTIMGERKNYLFSLVSVSPKSQRAACHCKGRVGPQADAGRLGRCQVRGTLEL